MAGANGAHPVSSLWDRLGAIPDRRGRKGRQYGLASVLVVSLAAANDLRAIFRRGRRLPRVAFWTPAASKAAA